MNTPGWAFLWNAKKAHYFAADGRSLCGRWLFLGQYREPGNVVTSPDDCLACTRKLTNVPKQSNH
jgi:hypothetical protein